VAPDTAERRDRDHPVNDPALFWAAVLQSAEDAIVGTTLDGRVLSWNAGAERIFGYSADEMLGHPITRIVPTERLAEANDMLRRIRRGERIVALETERTGRGGERVQILFNISPVRDHDGRIVGAAAIGRDITRRKRLEQERGHLLAQNQAAQAQAEAAQMFRSVLESAPDGVAVVDRGGHIILANDHVERLFGYTREELIGQPVEILVPEQRRKQHKSHRRGYGRSPHSRPMGVGLDLTGRRKDGTEFPIEISLSPVQGSASGLVTAVIRDITERKVAEARARQLAREQAARAQAEASRERLRFLADAGVALGSSLDYEATLTAVARLAVGMLGDFCVVYLVDEQGEIHRVAGEHVDPRMAPMIEHLLRLVPLEAAARFGVANVIRTGRSELVERLDPDWTERVWSNEGQREVMRALAPTSAMFIPLIARGRTLGAIAFGRSGRMQAFGPADLALAEELAARCALAVDNARLYEQSQEAVRLRDEFLSTATHELKTPVAVIRGYAQLLQRWNGATTDPRRARVPRILEQQSDRLARLVDDLLQVSRLRLGGEEFEKQGFELGVLAAEVLDEMEALTTRHRLELRHDSLVKVQADRSRLQQVLVNLVSNAIKYSPHGGTILVSVAVHGGDAVVSVADEGIGIPLDRQEHIFERFYRAHAGTPHDYGGMGVGLHLSREIVVRLGGRMWFVSREGEGSTFSFSLPIAGDSR
jgi:PAS domain S-box-containing protein